MVRTGVQRAFGSKLRRFLGEWLSNRFAAFGAGLGVTTILQSSTATCLMTSDFAARGIVVLPVALAIMLGADVGTSLVAQIFSLDFSWLSPVLLIVGFVIHSSTKNQKRANIGRLTIGLGLILLALKTIVGASAPLRESETLLTVIAALDGEPLIAILIAALMTWAAHSSLAIVLLVGSLAGAGTIPVSLGLILILGANLGGALPPIMATLNASIDGRRVALGNGMFKFLGCLAFFPFLTQVENYLVGVDPDPVRMLVNFHMGFNLALAVVFITATNLFASFLQKILKEKESDERSVVRYLDESTVLDPTIGLNNATREVLRMGDELDHMLKDSFEMLRNGNLEKISEIAQSDDVVDEIYEAVKVYLTRIRKVELDDEESQSCGEIMAFCANLEHIGDIIDKNLLVTAHKLVSKSLKFSDEGLSELSAIHERVHGNLRLAMGVFMSKDTAMARRLLVENEVLRKLEQDAANSHLARFQQGRIETLETSSLHLDVIRDLKRINSHLTAVAYPILDEAGELRESRLRKKYLRSVETRPIG